MSRNQRFGVLAVAAVILLAAFLVLRPNGAATPTSPRNDARPAVSAAPAAGSATPPSGPLLVAGKIEQLRVAKGQQVRFRVRSTAADELHIHGYDIKRQLAAGRTVPVSFTASIDGVFVIELEGAGEQIASLRVDP